MMYPNAYLDYLVYFHGHRDYFECHEVLEEYWKKDQAGKKRFSLGCLDSTCRWLVPSKAWKY